MHERKKIHNYWISRYSVRKVFFRDLQKQSSILKNKDI